MSTRSLLFPVGINNDGAQFKIQNSNISHQPHHIHTQTSQSNHFKLILNSSQHHLKYNKSQTLHIKLKKLSRCLQTPQAAVQASTATFCSIGEGETGPTFPKMY